MWSKVSNEHLIVDRLRQDPSMSSYGYEECRAAFLAEGVSIIAGTVDTQEQTAEASCDLGFPVAYGMTRADGDAMGS